MNGFRWSIAIAAVVFGGVARAESGPGIDSYYYPTIRPAQNAEDYVSLGTAPVPPPVVEPNDPIASSVEETPAAAAQPCPCDNNGCRRGCNLGEPWKLPQPCFLQQRGIVLGGWLQQGITGNTTHPSDGFNGPVATNDRAGEYEMNQLWFYLFRPTKTDGCGWDVGGRVDAIYGSDWRYGMCRGLESRFDDHDSLYGLVLPQFYGEVAYNDLTVRAGHYAAAFGYEQIPAPLNFFYSHSYMMSNEPILVTGMDATYALNDRLKVFGGFNRGWMMFEDNNEDLDFLGGVKWNSCDKRTDIAFTVTTGPQDDAGVQNTFLYSLIFHRQITERLGYVLQNDVGNTEGGDPRTGSDAEWYAIAQYLFYKINPCWTAGLRFEWFRDDDGARVAGVGNWIGSDKGWTGAPGFAGNFYELTAGLNWRPHANFCLRPEIRYDWYDGTTNLANQLPYGGGSDKNQLLLAADLIFTY
jgi:hypothetical protein